MNLHRLIWNMNWLRAIAGASALIAFTAPLAGAETLAPQTPDLKSSYAMGPVLPDACYIIFPTEEIATIHCPAGAKAVVAYDFWQNQPLGWSCDCEKLAP